MVLLRWRNKPIEKNSSGRPTPHQKWITGDTLGERCRRASSPKVPLGCGGEMVPVSGTES